MKIIYTSNGNACAMICLGSTRVLLKCYSSMRARIYYAVLDATQLIRAQQSNNTSPTGLYQANILNISVTVYLLLLYMFQLLSLVSSTATYMFLLLTSGILYCDDTASISLCLHHLWQDHSTISRFHISHGIKFSHERRKRVVREVSQETDHCTLLVALAG